MFKNLAFIFFIASITFSQKNSFSQKFIHPGINQTSKDLDYMKSLVLNGKQPYKET